MIKSRIMKRVLKIVIILVAVIIAVFGLAIISAEHVLNSSQVKSQIENIVGETLDMRFKIEGRIKLVFWPFMSVVANKLKVSTSQGEIASADRIKIDPRLMDLIFLKVHLDDVHIHSPQLTFNPLAFDKILALTVRGSDEPLPVESMVIDSFRISNAKFYYADDETVIDLNKMELTGGEIAIIEGRKVIIDDVFSFFKAIHFTGNVSAGEISTTDYKLENIRATVKDQYGILTADPVELDYLESKTQLRAVLDLTAIETTLTSHLALSGLNLEPLAKQIYPGGKVKGNLNVIADVSVGEIDIDRILAGMAETAESDPSTTNDRLVVKSLKLGAFTVAGTGISYSEGTTSVDFKHLDIEGSQLNIINDHQVLVESFETFIKAAVLKGKAISSRISVSDHTFQDILADFSIDQGILNAEVIELSYLDSRTKFSGRLDLKPEKPHLKLHATSSGLNLSSFAKKFYPQITAKGKLNITATVSATDIELNQLLEISKKTSPSGTKQARDMVPVKSIEVNLLKVSGKDLAFSGKTAAADIARLNLSVSPLSVIENSRLTFEDFKSFLRMAKFTGMTQIHKVAVADHKFENIRFGIVSDNGILKSDPFELDYFGAHTIITTFLNMKDNLNHLKVQIEMPEVSLQKFFENSEGADLVKGVINIKAEFEVRAAFMGEILKNASGNFSIKGQNLTLKSVDLDKALDEFKKISGYGFNDFSALLLLGPLGPIVSHGYDQLDALEKMMKATGDSKIQHVVSDWKVANSVFVAADVAFSTQRNRVAVKGGFDLSNKKFNSMTIAVVDPNGCIVNSETVDGTFENPEIKDVGVIERTVVRPLKRFFKTKCDFFYDGTVPHPTGQR